MGNRFKDKWGTSDVVGVREPRKSDIVKFGTEIITGEVKIDSAGLITAFGQACAYRLFSHKSYIVVPEDSPEMMLQGWTAKHEPDMFYVNRYMKLVEDDLFT